MAISISVKRESSVLFDSENHQQKEQPDTNFVDGQILFENTYLISHINKQSEIVC